MPGGATERADVCVVGLGAVGSQAVLQLARRGLRVVGIDRFRPPHALGSSHGATRVIREAYFEHPLYVPLVQRSYELWAGLERDAGRALLRPTGGLMLGPPDGPIVAGSLASAREHGLSHELLTAAQVRSRFPAFRVPDGEVGVLEPRAGVLDCEACVEAALALARGAGADLRLDLRVRGWESGGDAVLVRTELGAVEADRVILAVGAWVGELAGPLAVPLQPSRQPLVWLAPAARAELFTPGRFPVFIWELGHDELVYGFPDLGEGVKVARHGGGEPTTADTVDRTLRATDVDWLRSRLAGRLPDAAGPLRGHAVCLYTTSPDGHPVLDRHPRDPRVLVASPCSGHGFKFTPAVGEILADLVMDRPARFDLAPFGLARPTLG